MQEKKNTVCCRCKNRIVNQIDGLSQQIRRFFLFFSSFLRIRCEDCYSACCTHHAFSKEHIFFLWSDRTKAKRVNSAILNLKPKQNQKKIHHKKKPVSTMHICWLFAFCAFATNMISPLVLNHATTAFNQKGNTLAPRLLSS